MSRIRENSTSLLSLLDAPLGVLRWFCFMLVDSEFGFQCQNRSTRLSFLIKTHSLWRRGGGFHSLYTHWQSHIAWRILSVWKPQTGHEASWDICPMTLTQKKLSCLISQTSTTGQGLSQPIQGERKITKGPN